MQKQSSSGTAPSGLSSSVVGLAPPSQRRRILDAMVACCAEKTYAGTTIADLVSRAAVSRTTFYKLFTDKRDCFDAAVTQCIDRIGATLAASAAGFDSPAGATRRATVAALELLAAEPELALVLGGDMIGVDPDQVDRYGRLLIPALEALWAEAGEPPRKHSSPGLAFGRAQLLVFHEVTAGRAAGLPALVPDFVYLAIAPFAGHDEALRQARLAGAEAATTEARP
ncbi:MAG TPA: TetR/AcrR family transcriptional regulator [Solirubrobacterales bacterium]|nr:TetR/AcrR family transcriptional regulator [Solirubrobacterales bacterium]